MPRLLWFLALPLLACALPLRVAADPAPQDAEVSAKALLEKVVRWQGGRASLGAVRYLSIKGLNVTVHGKDGTNEASVRRLKYQLPVGEATAKIAFLLDAAGSTRTFGLDGRRFWLRKPNFAQFISEQTTEGAADIERIRDALDVLSTLFITSLMDDGEPFELKGRTKGGEAGTEFQYLFSKKDRRRRRLSLVVRADGSIVRATREKKFPSEDRQGKPTFVKVPVVVLPSDFIEVDPPDGAGDTAGKIRLPTKVVMQINSKPWITLRIPDDNPFSFRTIAAKHFKLKKR